MQGDVLRAAEVGVDQADDQVIEDADVLDSDSDVPRSFSRQPVSQVWGTRPNRESHVALAAPLCFEEVPGNLQNAWVFTNQTLNDQKNHAKRCSQRPPPVVDAESGVRRDC